MYVNDYVIKLLQILVKVKAKGLQMSERKQINKSASLWIYLYSKLSVIEKYIITDKKCSKCYKHTGLSLYFEKSK